MTFAAVNILHCSILQKKIIIEKTSGTKTIMIWYNFFKHYEEFSNHRLPLVQYLALIISCFISAQKIRKQYSSSKKYPLA